MTPPAGQPLRCRCGSSTFGARIRRDEGVGLLTCESGHHSLLLDSRDYWGEAIQAGRPREAICRCGSRAFTVSVAYESREASPDVRAVDVTAICAKCRTPRQLLRVDIKYSPTTVLVERPLDPIDDPWLKARWIQFTGFWTDADHRAVVEHVADEQNGVLLLGPPTGPAQPVSPSAVLQAVRDRRSYALWIAPGVVEVPMPSTDCWKWLPIVQMSAPYQMHLPEGVGHLQYVQFAEEILRDGRVVPQPEEFVRFARDLIAWMRTRFVSGRGPNALDSAEEFARLKLGRKGNSERST